MARQRIVRLGAVGLGTAWNGMERQRKARIDESLFTRRGEAWYGHARLGMARQGQARHGQVRLGGARQGTDWGRRNDGPDLIKKRN